MQYGTFGVTEARERFAGTISTSVTKETILSPQMAALIQRSIEEVEKEAVAQPFNPQYPIFLGKLYTQESQLTRLGFQQAEDNYKKTLFFAPRYIPAYLGLAKLYVVAGEKEKASALAQQIKVLPVRQETSLRLLPPLLSIYLLSNEPRKAGALLEQYHAPELHRRVQGELGITQIQTLIIQTLASSKKEDRLYFLNELGLFFKDASFRDINGAIYPTILIGIAQTYGEMGDKKNACETALRAQELDSTWKDQVDAFILSLRSLP